MSAPVDAPTHVAGPWRRAWRRRQAWIAAALLLACFVAASRLARLHLAVRADVSEDRLAAWSPATDAILARLEDQVVVEAFFTRDLEHGVTQVAAGHLIDQLDELEARAKGRLEVVYTDPGRSGEARLRAVEEYGIRPFEFADAAGTVVVQQEVFLGLVVRYRDKQEVLPVVLPNTLEYALLSSLHRMTRLRAPVLGWSVPPELEPRLRGARETLARTCEVRTVAGLAEGLEVAEDVDVLLVVAPRELHPRAAYEIEAFARRGGALLLCAERVVPDEQQTAFETFATGLEGWLVRCGVSLARGLAFDPEYAVELRGRAHRYPFGLFLRGDAFAADTPVSARQRALLLTWASPLRIEDEVSPDLIRRVLVQSSTRAYAVPAPERFEQDEESMALLHRELLMREDAAVLPLVVEVAGELPAERTAGAPPAAFDPLTGRDAASSDSTVRELAEAPGRLLVVGDSDWLLDPPGAQLPADHRTFLANLVDWLGAAPELVDLRTKTPRPRPLRDFFAEELAARGLLGSASVGGAFLGDTAELERARASADRRRRVAMAAATGTSLACVALLGLAAWLRRRAPALATVPDANHG